MVKLILRYLHLGKLNRAGHHEASYVIGWDAAAKTLWSQEVEARRVELR